MKINCFNSINGFFTKAQQYSNNPVKVRKAFYLFNSFMIGSLFGTLTTMCTDSMETQRHAEDIQKEVKELGVSQEEINSINGRMTVWNTRNKAVAWQEVLDSVKASQAQKVYQETLKTEK